MAPQAPSRTDKRAANRICLRRLEPGMSPEDLARLLDVTFQQVHKYERDTIRVGAGYLREIARLLCVPLRFFYEDGPGTKMRTQARP